MGSSPTTHSYAFQASYVEVDGRTHYLAPGHRLTIGSSPNCDIVLSGPGVEKSHARLSQRIDGRISVKPLGGAVRVGTARLTRTTAVPPSKTLGIGLTLLRTGPVDHNLYIHLLLELRKLRGLGRRIVDATPWFLLSAIFHAILILLLFAFLEPGGRGKEDGHHASLLIPSASESTDLEEEAEESIEDVQVDEAEFMEPPLPQPEIEEKDKSEEPAEFMAGLTASGEEFAGEALFDDLGNGGRRSRPIPRGIKSGFRKTIVDYRRRGLEVALLFDSTGSMGGTLDEAKRSLRRLLEKFEELVPGTRVALLTYRDHGADYVTRQTTLGTHHFEALAFLSSVQSGQGGDFPEAVEEALAKALKLRWNRRSHKVIVVVGDAPPREGSPLRRSADMARRFRRRRGQVHFLQVRGIDETKDQMQKIVRAGGGRILALEDDEKLIRELLALAFGPEAKNDLDRLLREQGRRRARHNRRARGRLPSASDLIRTLKQIKPDPRIVEPWTHVQPQKLGELVSPLRRAKLSKEGLQALYYVANHVLERHNVLPELLWPEGIKPPVTGVPRKMAAELKRLSRH